MVLYSKVAKPADQGKRTSKPRSAKTQKLADFMVTGGFDVPDHPPGVFWGVCCGEHAGVVALQLQLRCGLLS